MVAVWARALAYLLIVGAGWLVALPAGILAMEWGSPWPELRAPSCAAVGGAAFAGGFGLACWAGFCLIQYGRGTPLPLDPPRRLVVCGPYRWVRNPQGIAMTLMVAGEIVAVRSSALWILLPLTLAYLELLVGPWEERQLLRDFGADYACYVHQVRKWRPTFGWRAA